MKEFPFTEQSKGRKKKKYCFEMLSLAHGINNKKKVFSKHLKLVGS